MSGCWARPSLKACSAAGAKSSAKSSADCITASVFAALKLGPVASRQEPARKNGVAPPQRTADAPGACSFGAVTCGKGNEGAVSGSGGAGAGGLSLSHDTVANTASINAITARTEDFMTQPFA